VDETENDLSKPKLYRPQASPGFVRFGMQPKGSPLVLSVESRRMAGKIVAVTVNLSALVAARIATRVDLKVGKMKEIGVVNTILPGACLLQAGQTGRFINQFSTGYREPKNVRNGLGSYRLTT